MNNILLKALSGFGIVSVIFILGFYSGYKVKSNAINSYNAKQDIKLATLQSRYDNIANVSQLDYLTTVEELTNAYNKNNGINNGSSKFDKLWSVLWFNHHSTSKMYQVESTECLDAKTKTRLRNGKLNSIQLLFLQSYIKQTQELPQ